MRLKVMEIKKDQMSWQHDARWKEKLMRREGRRLDETRKDEIKRRVLLACEK